MQRSPVCTATRPAASTTATWRNCWRSSAATSRASASSGGTPLARAGRARSGRRTDRRSTASRPPRRPARAHETTEPTLNQCDCTATPTSPVSRVAGDDRVCALSHARQRIVADDGVSARRTQAVLARVRAIPPGFVRSYGDVSPGAPRFAGTVLHADDDPDLPVAPRRARRRLAREGRAPARRARGRGRAVPRGPRRHARGTIGRRCGSSVTSPCAPARAGSIS